MNTVEYLFQEMGSSQLDMNILHVLTEVRHIFKHINLLFCFHLFFLESGCSYCLNFGSRYQTFENGVLSISIEVTTECDQMEMQIYQIDYVVHGESCGSIDYFALPCPSHTQRDYTTSISSQTVNNLLNSVDDYIDSFDDRE